MNLRRLHRAFLSIALAGTLAAALSQVTPAAHAAYGPSITAVADTVTPDVVLVAGRGFTPSSTATIVVSDAAHGTSMASVTVAVNARGAFVRIVNVDPPCVTPAALPVMVWALDATQAKSNGYAVSLSTPVALAQAQVAQATAALRQLLHSGTASQSRIVVAQAAVIAAYARLSAAQAAAQAAGTC